MIRLNIAQTITEFSRQLQNISDTPLLDAQIILANTLKIKQTGLFTEEYLTISETTNQKLLSALAKRKNGMPVSYIIGRKEFYGLQFTVNKSVLIPRPESELIVDLALEFLHQQKHTEANLLDMCTGSGCLAISIAHEFENDLNVDCLDISHSALQVCKYNASKLLNPTKLNLFDFQIKDLHRPQSIRKKYHMIISNPPYIPTQDIRELMPDVRDFEPHLALDGGRDGLLFYKKLRELCLHNLIAGGVAIFEINSELAPKIVRLFEKSNMYQVKLHPDLSGRDRVITLQS